MTKASSILAVVVWALAGCVVESDTSDLVTSSQELNATGQLCGGIAGIACPSGYECVDDPTDGCDPNAGGADCGGICQRSRGNRCNDPSKTYVSRDPAECATIRFVCAEGSQAFFDDQCGCGCQTPEASCGVLALCAPGYHWDDVRCRCVRDEPTGGGARCGDRHCGSGEYCCNASCGICAPIGGGCIQIACTAI